MDIIHHTQILTYNELSHVIVTENYNYMNYSAIGNTSENIYSKTYDNDRELASLQTMERWNMFGVKLLYYKTSYDINYDRIFLGTFNNEEEASIAYNARLARIK